MPEHEGDDAQSDQGHRPLPAGPVVVDAPTVLGRGFAAPLRAAGVPHHHATRGRIAGCPGRVGVSSRQWQDESREQDTGGNQSSGVEKREGAEDL